MNAAGMMIIASCVLLPPGSAAAHDRAGVHTVFVTPAGAQGGDGSAQHPFMLAAGREYALNRLIRPVLDRGTPVRIVFKDGVYVHVRLQIIKQGIDTFQYDLRKNIPEPGTKPAACTPGPRCNAARKPGRVSPADFTMGPETDTALNLAAEHRGKAILDGANPGATDPLEESEALVISGAAFGGPAAEPYRIRSRRISNVGVQGLVFRNYRNGLHISYAERIAVRDCIIDSIGTHTGRQAAEETFGTFALRVDRDSRLVLIAGNRVTNVWNAAGDAAANAANDPGLIHAVYQGDARDVVFLKNIFRGSSGPMVKFGFYPLVHGSVVYQYPAAAADRRSFFIGNDFTLNIMSDGRQAIPPYPPTQSFIHDNSRVPTPRGPGAPAAGMVFIDNSFENRLPPDPAIPVALIRQELPASGNIPLFPGWFFCGNRISGIEPGHIVASRRRGTQLSARTLQFSTDGPPPQFGPTASRPPAGGEQTGCQNVKTLLSFPLRSGDPEEDRNALYLLQHGEMPPAGRAAAE